MTVDRDCFYDEVGALGPRTSGLGELQWIMSMDGSRD